MHEDDALAVIGAVAEERGAAGIVAEVRRARRLLGEGRFNVAVLGQFKRGKSTLINALLRRSLLPTDVAPLTSTITIVEHGEEETARVLYADGRREFVGVDEIAAYVSEEGNPGNVKGIEAVVVTLPAPLLAGGIRLVDTPGVGSVFAPNSEVTRRYLQRIDVALMVLGFDPPISGEELALAREVAGIAGQLAFVLNKVDLADAAAREKADAFTRAVLRRELGERSEVVFHASAKRAAAGEEGGVAALATWLSELAARSGVELARGSARRACRALSGRLLQDVDLETQALTRPLEEISAQIAEFRTAVQDVDALALAATVRVGREDSDYWAGWNDSRKEFEREVLRRVVRRTLEAIRSLQRPSRAAMRAAGQEVARDEVAAAVDAYHRQAVAAFEQFKARRREVVEREAASLVERVSKAASKAFGMTIASFDAQPPEVDLDAGVFEFVTPTLALDLSAWLVPMVDALLPRALVTRRVAASARSLAADWLRQNLYEVDRHLTDWLDVLRQSLEAQLRERLDALRDEVLEAVEQGRRAQEQGQLAVRDALARLASQRQRLTQALDLAAGGGPPHGGRGAGLGSPAAPGR